MRAIDISEEAPLVTRQTLALDAVRMIADNRLAGLVLEQVGNQPPVVFSALELLRLLVPNYIREDPALARVYDDSGAADLWAVLRENTIADLLEAEDVTLLRPPHVREDATLLELAAEMLAHHSQIALIHSGPGDPIRLVRLSSALVAILAATDDAVSTEPLS